MGRIHARTKGKSGSKKPVKKDLSFASLSKKEVEKKVVELYKEGTPMSSIGLVLRDTYAVPDIKAYTGKSISKILEENKFEVVPEDLNFLIEKARRLEKHLENNRKDIHNKRSHELVVAKIRRLTKYYQRIGRVSPSWKYR